MKDKILQSVSNYQTNLYPGYSSTSPDKSLYSMLYHGSLAKFLRIEPIYNETKNKLLNKLDKNGFLHPETIIDNASSNHTKEYISLHMTSIFYCMYEKDTQNASNFILENSNSIEKRWHECSFQNAWGVSNELMAWATLVSLPEKSNLSDKLADFLLGHETFKDGLWQSKSRRFKGKINSLAATFHYLPFFLHKNIRVPGSENYFNYIKQIDIGNGFFSLPRGYACIDYDVAYLIFYYVVFYNNFLIDSDREYLIKILKKLNNQLYNIQNNDGGFPEYGYPNSLAKSIFYLYKSFLKNHCVHSSIWNTKKIYENHFQKNKIIYSNSSSMCGSGIHESNIFSSWFRLLTIDISNTTLVLLEDKNKTLPRFTKNFPGIGYNPFKEF